MRIDDATANGSKTKSADAMNKNKKSRNSRANLAGLAIAVALLVFGWWLARELTAASKMQDCLMSGRSNCNTIESPAQ
jgi:hypothetical protein